MDDIRLDVEGILQIAGALLQVIPRNGSEKVISAQAESFVRTPTDATVDELLSVGTWHELESIRQLTIY
jgi:hypothetical protein